MKTAFRSQPTPESVRGRSVAFWSGVWLPAVLACIVIACESTPTFSAGNTSSWLRPIFERFLGPISDDHWQLGHHIFRKSGHFLGYGGVGLTFLRAWLYTLARKPGLSAGRWRLHASAAAVFSTFVVASLDEWHQTFLPSRTGAFSDVLIDTAGALLMCAFVSLLFRWWR